MGWGLGDLGLGLLIVGLVDLGFVILGNFSKIEYILVQTEPLYN